MFGRKKKNKKNRKNSTTSPINTVISPDVEVSGDIKGENAIKIDGKVRGDIDIQKSVLLGERGIIEGNVKSKDVVIYGQVTGNIAADNMLLKNTGKVEGDIDTHTIEIELGGICNGRLSMKPKQPETVSTDDAKKRPLKAI